VGQLLILLYPIIVTLYNYLQLFLLQSVSRAAKIRYLVPEGFQEPVSKKGCWKWITFWLAVNENRITGNGEVWMAFGSLEI
jgi:hypothetical protein